MSFDTNIGDVKHMEQEELHRAERGIPPRRKKKTSERDDKIEEDKNIQKILKEVYSKKTAEEFEEINKIRVVDGEVQEWEYEEFKLKVFAPL